MPNFFEERIIEEGMYIVEHKATVRDTARVFGVGKSTVHKDVAERLRYYNVALYSEVREVLNENLKERHIRGGEATKRKYAKMKE